MLEGGKTLQGSVHACRAYEKAYWGKTTQVYSKHAHSFLSFFLYALITHTVRRVQIYIYADKTTLRNLKESSDTARFIRVITRTDSYVALLLIAQLTNCYCSDIVRGLLQGLLALGKSEDSSQVSHRRETVHLRVPGMQQSF